MKVKLKNFKCWKEKELDFGNHGGITLLSGKSGIGKSSILEAIFFAICGQGSKITSHGTSSCSVEIEFDDLKLKRSRRPNILVVNDKDEDKVGQEIIDRKIGTNFGITSFLRQNSYSSFILLGPQDKLLFLEEFALKDSNIIQKKRQVKELIKERDTDLMKVQIELEMVNKILSSKLKPDEVKFPIKCLDKNRSIIIKNEEILFKNSQIKKKRKLRGVEKLRNTYTEVSLFENTLVIKNLEKSSLTTKLEKFEKELESVTILNLEINLEKNKDILFQLINQREVKYLEKRFKEDDDKYKKLFIEEKNQTDFRIKEIEKTLWDEYSYEEVKNLIVDYKNYENDSLEYELLNKNIESIDKSTFNNNLEEDIQNLENSISKKLKSCEILKLEKNLYPCPNCDSKLQFKDKQLILSKIQTNNEKISIEDVEKEIELDRRKKTKSIKKLNEIQEMEREFKKLSVKIKEIENKYDEKISKSKKISNDLLFLEEFLRNNKELEKELSKLKNHQSSSILKNLKNELDKLSQKLDSLKTKKTTNYFSDDVDEESIREIIKTLEIQIEDYRKLEIKVQEINDDIQNCKEIIQNEENKIKSKFEKIINSNSIKEELEKTEKYIQNLDTLILDHQTNLKKIEDFQRYKSQFEEYNSLVNDKDRLTKEEIDYRDKLSASNLLKEKINIAEAIIISNFIETINKHAQIYLDIFFQDNPINVTLQAFKEDKKKNKKPQVSIDIEYKGMECDINSLSGGELQRVVIAFTISLAEIFSTPILLLDECTSNLDQELTNIVVRGIKENYSGKQVILIAHQVVSGVFDHVIQLE